jgi:hypothetical protein
MLRTRFIRSEYSASQPDVRLESQQDSLHEGRQACLHDIKLV